MIVAAASLWAVDGVLRRSLFTLLPLIIIFYEHLVGSVLVTPFAVKGLSHLRLTKQLVGLVLIIALVSGLLGTLMFTKALFMVGFIPFSVVLLLQKLQPIFAASTAHVFLGEKITRRYVLWAGVAIVAGFFMTFPNGQVNLTDSWQTVVAALLALGAAAAWGSSTTFSKMLLTKIDATTATSLRFYTTTILAFVAIVIFGLTAELSSINANQLGTIVLIALSTGLVALWLYYKGLQHTEAKIATILELTFPLLAVLIDVYFYGTILLPTQYMATGVMIFAMVMVGRLGSKREY